MTQVFFYHGAANKLAAAGKLLAGAAAQKKAVLVYVPDPVAASDLDRLLWTQVPTGFTPHCLATSPLAAETPILLARQLDALPQNERLMNLGHAVPPDFVRFTSLIEVVGRDEDDRLAARDRVRQYKESGCEVKYFDLSESS